MTSLLSVFFSISLLVGICYRTTSYALSQYSAYAVEPDIYAALEFVRMEVEPGSTVLAADPEINVRIRSFAPVYVYMAAGWGTFATTDEVLTRAAEILRFFGIEPQGFIDSDLYNLDIPGTGAKGLVTPHLLLFNGSLDYPTKESRLLALQDVYWRMTDGTLTYPVDYVWFGPYERTLGKSDLAERPSLELLYQNKTVTLYQYSSPQNSGAAHLISSFDVFVLPSWTEGLPITVLEAIAAARPVIATDVGGVSELVLDGETGLLISARDPTSLSEAIIWMLENSEDAREFGKNGYKRVKSCFSTDRMLQEIFQLYDSVVQVATHE